MYANSTGHLVSDISLDRLSVASGCSGHDLRRDIKGGGGGGGGVTPICAVYRRLRPGSRFLTAEKWP